MKAKETAPPIPSCVKLGCAARPEVWTAVGPNTIFFACSPHAEHYKRVMGYFFRPLPRPMTWPTGWNPLPMRGKVCGLVRTHSAMEVGHAFD